MKHHIIAVCLIMNNLSLLSNCAGQDQLSVLKGTYLGQSPPGRTPVMFAPNFFVKEVHSCPTYSPNMKELYWDLMEESGCTLFMKLEGGIWSKPEKVPYASRLGACDPCFSPDGKKLFFTSNEAPNGGRKDSKENIWTVEKRENGWSVSQPLPAVVNKHSLHWQISVAENGNLYFSTNKDILCAETVDGKYTTVVHIGESVNSSFYEGTPFVAPDESYIIFSRFGGDLEYADLFISFRQSNGSWSAAQNMGNTINTMVHELCPQVTPDGRYLFFIRNDTRGDLRPFWVDAGIIEALRQTE